MNSWKLLISRNGSPDFDIFVDTFGFFNANDDNYRMIIIDGDNSISQLSDLFDNKIQLIYDFA